MWIELSLFGLWLKFSAPSEKPLNFIAERYDWFPNKINNTMIYIFTINWIISIIILEMYLLKMKKFLNYKIKDRKNPNQKELQFIAFERPDLFWINRVWLYLCVWTFITSLF